MFSRTLRHSVGISKRLQTVVEKSFGARAGPYNPYKYKEYLVPRNMPK